MKKTRKIISIVLSVLMIASVVVAVPIEPYAATTNESEPNDTYNSANSLIMNNSIKGNLSSSEDVDYFKINPTSNGELNINFHHMYINSDDVCWDVAVIIYANDSYTELSKTRIYGYDNEIIKLPMTGVTSSQTYYLKVYTRWDDDTVGKDYTLSTSFTSSEDIEKELNNTYYTATNSNFNSTYKGTMNTSSDEDFYKFASSDYGSLKLSFKHRYIDNSDIYWNISIIKYTDGEYEEISSLITYGNSGEIFNLPTIGTVPSGVYYIKVTTHWDSTIGEEYSLTNSFTKTQYYEKEINNTYYTATLCNRNIKYTGCMNNSNDLDFYKTVPSSSGNMKISFYHKYTADSDVYWNVYVYKYSEGQYTELENQRVDGSDDENIDIATIEVEANGEYYIKITTHRDSTIGKEYEIMFNKPDEGGVIQPTTEEPTEPIETQPITDEPTEPTTTEPVESTTAPPETQPVFTEPVTTEPVESTTAPPETQPVFTEPVTFETMPPTTAATKKNISKWTVEGLTDKEYTGKIIKPEFDVVSRYGEYATFNATYLNNKNVGTATVIITGSGDYYGEIRTTFNIKKAYQHLSVKTKKYSIKLQTLKNKSKSIKAIKVSNAQGKVTYKLIKIGSTAKLFKKAKINAKGIITIKKGKFKKGTYKLKVKITATGNKNYKSKSVSKVVKIKIR